MLGFLSLLSLIQSGLTTTTVAPGRRRRDVADNYSEIIDSETVKLGPDAEREAQSQKIADIVLPLLVGAILMLLNNQSSIAHKLICITNTWFRPHSHLQCKQIKLQNKE